MIRTVSRPIYQKENRADIISFLIDKSFIENIDEYNIILQVILPNGQDETISGKSKTNQRFSM